jgi:cbb3-type cytochrome oxidase cytochrome c subunit/cytochrome c553
MTTNRANYLYPSIGMGLILASIIFVVVLVPRWTFSTQVPKPKDLRNYTAQELRGREIYKREGCWYCHSQVSRPQDWDHGVKSKSSDYYYDEYHLVGSERSGPDLSNIGGKFPDEYHIIHHQNPRAVKPGSNMPRFDFLSLAELNDLTAYLQSLGPNGRRALDVKTGEMKWAKFVTATGPDGKPEQVAVWKDGVKEREAIVAAQYEAHPEVPYKYHAEVEELMYGTSHEAQNAKTPLKALATPAFPTEAALEEARKDDPETKAWAEVSFKEPEVMPADPVEAAAVVKRRTIANQGKGMFNQMCSACHGLTGNGHGWAAPTMTKRPANFTEAKFENYTTDTWYWRVSRGVPATQMPRWELTLAPDQRLYLSAFLKYIAQNKGLGKLEGMPVDNYDQKLPGVAIMPAPAK